MMLVAGSEAKRFVRFLTVGAFATVVNFAGFLFLLRGADFDYRIASAAGFLAGVGAGYSFNKKWTFQSHAGHSVSLMTSYLGVYTISLVMSLALLEWLVRFASLPAVLANIVCIGFTTMTNFLGTSLLFRNKPERQAEDPVVLSDLLQHPVFLAIAILKLVAAASLTSDYLLKLFMPFLDAFAAAPGQDPYSAFIAQGNHGAFPYPAGMLYLVGSLRLVLAGLGFSDIGAQIGLFLYRVPLFVADLAILMTLLRWIPRQGTKVLAFYWASPVLFYITYVHGQLDVIPMALLFLALRFLFEDRAWAAAIFLGLAIASKTHVGIALPLILLYLWRRSVDLRSLLTFIGIVLVTFTLVNLQFISSSGFHTMVFANHEQEKIWNAALSFSGNGPNILLIPAAYILLLAVALRLPVQNRDVILMFTGVFFGALLLLVPPMPGWYFWVLPFFAYFFVRAPRSHAVLYFALQLAYFGFFLLRQDADVPHVFQLVSPQMASTDNAYGLLEKAGSFPSFFVDLAFTGLQTLLGVNCLWLRWRGISNIKNSPLWSRSFVVAIAGDSGSGKTTVASILEALFTSGRLTTICGDDMHRWPRGHHGWLEFTHLNPKGNELHLELQYLKALRQNKIIQRRHYDHQTGKFTSPVAVKPRSVIVLEGLHPYFLQPARDLADLKIFLKPDKNLLLHWKIRRDMESRGYTREQVLATYDARRLDAQAYVDVQERFADLIISLSPRHDIEQARIGESDLDPDCVLSLTLSNKFWLDPLLDELTDRLGAGFEHQYLSDESQQIVFARPISVEGLREVTAALVPEFFELGIYRPDWCGGWNGLVQLVIAYLIFHESERFPNA
jgi:uridine kinase/putative flippase GtrA